MAHASTTDREVYGYVSVDEAHEVVAEAVPRARERVTWALLERPRGSAREDEWMRTERVVARAAIPQEVTDLEMRLAAAGEYVRVLAPRNPGVRIPANTRAVDLRSHAAAIPDAPPGTYLEYFHFHHEGGESRVVLTMPRFHANEQDRFILADFTFPQGDPQAGEVHMRHPRLPAPTVISQVAGSHIELPRVGFRKLFEPRDYERAFGRDWKDATTRALAAAATALFPSRRARVEPELPDEARLRDVKAALACRATRRARRELLPADVDVERVLRDGEFGIGRFMRTARTRVTARDQARLSLLEAALLVEYGLRSGRGRLVEEHSARLVRLARDYERLE